LTVSNLPSILQISPLELETFIETIEGVELVSVVGIPDPEAVDVAAAIIVKRKGFEALNESQVKDAVASKFPHYKHLHGGVYFVDELPMTANGKIQKRFVKEIAVKKRAERV
jgi:acyl-coenzyme A synthetase/AMP-(fatty) acid ligase